MDIHKLIHDGCEAAKHLHFPMLLGLAGSIRIMPKQKSPEQIGDLGDVPGDNILPKEILNSLISRRSL